MVGHRRRQGNSRTEFNIIYALVNLKPQQLVIKNCAVGMFKMTTDKHEASRGLSATAELLVTVVFGRKDCYVMLSATCW